MKRLWPLLILLAGCAPTPEEAQKPVVPVAKPEVTQLPPPVKLEGNPNRVHQLKDLKKVELSVKGSAIHAWVMDDEAKTQEGMMFLTEKEVKPDEGMLFVFDGPQLKADGRGFWMHNTLIPLDIVYLSPKGQVLNIGHGKVEDDSVIKADGDFQYVLEMKAGTSARLGLKAGDNIAIPKL